MGDGRFANIVLTGPCNLRCPWCIGRTSTRRSPRSTLDSFPLPGLETFARILLHRQIRQISLTGIDTEPLLYRHQGALLRWLRSSVPGAEVSLHTNGTLILRCLETFHRYDRATISIPSFDPATCRAMTGSARIVDLEAIARVARIPIKVSTLLTSDNQREIPAIVARCRALGVRRIVLRKLQGGGSPAPPTRGWRQTGSFGGNPVFDAGGIEVTVWDFARTSLPCVNLLPDGRCTDDYQLSPASASGIAVEA